MSANTLTGSAPAHAAPRPQRAPSRATRALMRTELKLFLREPVAVFWGVAFPVVLLVILGVATGHDHGSKDLGGLRAVDVYVPIVIAMSLGMLGVNALPPTVAAYREQGVLRRLATTPAGAPRVLGAQLAIFALVGAITTVLLVVVGKLAFSVSLPGSPVGFVVAVILSALSLVAIGLFIAAVAPTSKFANAAGAMSFFPLLFFAGLWVPRDVMPAILRHVSDATPLGAGVQAMQDATAGSFPGLLQLGVMVAWTVVFGAAAIRLFRWE
jgi:ABC-2 type transport system permease protein